MRRCSAVRALSSLGLIALAIVPLLASQTSQPARGQSIYVVAVPSVGEPQMFRPCVPGQSAAPAPAGPARELLPATWPPVPRRPVDADVKGRIEAEFRKRNRFRVVTSPDDADYVFLAEAKFDPVLMADTRSGIYLSYESDETPNLLQSVLAIVVQSAVYRQNPTDSAALLRARLWEGTTAGENEKGASPESLVRQFHTGERREPLREAGTRVSYGSPGLTVCPVPQPPRARPIQVEAEPAATGGNPPPAAGKPATASGATFKTHVLLVAVPVIAVDKEGKHVGDLKQSDFHVYEDDVEQHIDRLVPESEPVGVALVMDTSRSMRFQFEETKVSASTLIEALRADDRIMAVSFDSRVYVGCELTRDTNEVRRAIVQMRIGGGASRVYDALELVTTERLDRIAGRKAIVLLTDGMDVGSYLADSASVQQRIEGSNVPVYVVQYDTTPYNSHKIPSGLVPRMVPDGYSDKGPIFARASRYLQDLGRASGGLLVSASTVHGIVEAFRRTADELRRQYTLYYYPSNQTLDGSFRRIRVEVGRPDVAIRARTGYRAGTSATTGTRPK